MQVGVLIPQGWKGEYDGWDPLAAWKRTTEVAQQADRLGFESIWLFDHFHTVPRPTDEITFESFTSLSALAARTEMRELTVRAQVHRGRLGDRARCTVVTSTSLKGAQTRT